MYLWWVCACARVSECVRVCVFKVDSIAQKQWLWCCFSPVTSWVKWVWCAMVAFSASYICSIGWREKMCSSLNHVALKQKQAIKLTLGMFSRQNAAFFFISCCYSFNLTLLQTTQSPIFVMEMQWFFVVVAACLIFMVPFSFGILIRKSPHLHYVNIQRLTCK